MRSIAFVPPAWDEFCYLLETDKAVSQRIRALLEVMRRTPFEGIGKPEPLKHERAGTWSRRITNKHRLVYRVEQEVVWVLQCQHHYQK